MDRSVLMLSLYSQPWRKYHTLGHIDNVKANVKTLCDLAGVEPQNPEALEAAIDLHDIIYIPGQHGCEEASALIAESLGLMDAAFLIRQTEDHIAIGSDGMLLCDGDLLGLATNYEEGRQLIKAEVIAYCETIGLEFSEKSWVQGRSNWIVGFLTKHHLTPIFCFREHTHDWEQQARDNLNRELAELTAVVTS